MLNPLDAIKSELQGIASDVEHRVHVAVLREIVVATLSRLALLDEPNAAKYRAAVEALD